MTTSRHIVELTRNLDTSDTERLADLASEGLSALRDASRTFHYLPDRIREELSDAFKHMTRLVNARSMIDDGDLLFLEDLAEQASFLDGDIPHVGSFQSSCVRARNCANYVRDLIELDMQIKKRRGHRF